MISECWKAVVAFGSEIVIGNPNASPSFHGKLFLMHQLRPLRFQGSADERHISEC